MIRPLETRNLYTPSSVVEPRALGDARFVVHPHDWNANFEVVTRWQTDIVSGYYSGDETRTAVWLRPIREISSAHLEGDDATDFLRQWVARLSPREALPSVSGRYMTFGTDMFAQALLMCDTGVVESVPLQNQVVGDFTGMRFYEGQRAALMNKNFAPFTVGNEQVLAIPLELSTASRTQLVFPNPPVTVEPGMIVVPVLDVLPAEDVSVSMVSGRVASAEVTLTEASGKSQLPPFVSKGFIPPDFQTFQGQNDAQALPLLYVDQNWTSQPVEQQIRPIAEGTFPVVSGQRPRRGVQVVSGLDGLDLFRVARLFDSMQGAAGTFWSVMPSVIATQASRLTSTTIQLAARGNHREWVEQHGAVAFQLSDGTWSVHEVTDLDENWVLTVVQSVPDVSIRCLHWATRAHFTDELVEEWSTAGVVSTNFSVIEAPEPRDIELEQIII